MHNPTLGSYSNPGNSALNIICVFPKHNKIDSGDYGIHNEKIHSHTLKQSKPKIVV